MTTYVQVPVPEKHVPKVIALLANLDRGFEMHSATDPASTGPTLSLDANLVRRMYVDSEERHRSLLRFLAAHPGEWIFTSELAEAIGVDTGTKGMAGVFGAFGRRAKHRYGGVKPWTMAWDSARGEAMYRMEPETAEWLEEAV